VLFQRAIYIKQKLYHIKRFSRYESFYLAFLALLGGFNGLEKTIPRAEGVAMDEAGNLYMVSEPNLFYRFEKQ
jgi:uncharacterized protein YjiK